MTAIKSSKKLPIIGAVTLIAGLIVLWLVWFGPASLISEKMVDSNLQKLSAQLAEIGDENGVDAKLSYDKIDIVGWGYNKHAVVHNVKLDMADKSGVYPVRLRFSTDEVTVGSNAGRILLVFSKPIDFSQNEKVAKSFVFSEPLKYSFGQIKADAAPVFQHDIVLPKQISLFGSKGDAEETSDIRAGQEEQAVISFSNSPSLQLLSSSERKITSVAYDFSGLTISSKGQDMVTVEKWVSNFNENPTDTLGHTSGKYMLEMVGIILHGKGDAKPYNINVDTLFTTDSTKDSTSEKVADQQAADAKPDTVTSDTPSSDSATSAAPSDAGAPVETANNGMDETPDENRNVVLKQLVISNPDFKFSASGNFSNLKGDPLPSGEVNVEIENVQKFLESDLVSPQNRPLVENALVQITGKPLAEQTNISIPLKREKLGTFFIGKSNFEEIAAIWLSNLMMQYPGQGTPGVSPDMQLPQEPAPQGSAPQEPVTDLPGGSSPSFPATVPNP